MQSCVHISSTCNILYFYWMFILLTVHVPGIKTWVSHFGTSFLVHQFSKTLCILYVKWKIFFLHTRQGFLAYQTRFSCTPDKEIRGFRLGYKFLSHPCYITPKRNFSHEFSLHWLYRTSHNFVIRFTSFWHHSDIILKIFPTSASLYVVNECNF